MRLNRSERGCVRSWMHMRSLPRALVLLAVIPSGLAVARSMSKHGRSPVFELLGRPVGGATRAAPTPAHLTGGRIVAVGEAALVIDADSGALLKTDQAGNRKGQLAIGRDAGLMT